ncbi:MAG: hypothetical protein Q9174_001081 [Haloplaca sp. 1 TL-2023]
MASNTHPQTYLDPRKRTSFSSYAGNASIFLEKAKSGKRGSTPDSEALASSDDEQEQHLRLQSRTNLQGSRPVRRSSWLPDVHQAPQRTGSHGGGGSFSPGVSHPPTPSSEQMAWAANAGSSAASTTGRGHSSRDSIPWGSAIWSNDSQKGPPSRLTEVLPSPTSLVPPASAGPLVDDPLLSPTHSREITNESAIPFAIPLHPTLKTYRSQSYSVGQLDPESSNVVPTVSSANAYNTRSSRGTSYAGLQHRPSRPSMLGDPSYDSSLLGQLREVDDDDESSTGSEAGVQLNTQARTIEQLAMENAILRQAAAEQIENTRGQNRTIAVGSNAPLPRHGISNHPRFLSSSQDEGEYGLGEQGGICVGHSYSNEALRARRSSEYAPKSGSQYAMTGIPEHRNLDGFKKNHWQSSLGFGGIIEAPQSRRHSFAEPPTRQTSISSLGDLNSASKVEQGSRSSVGQSGPLGYQEGLARSSQGDGSEYARFRSRKLLEEMRLEHEHLRDRNFAASYFCSAEQTLHAEDIHGSSRSPATSFYQQPTNHPYSRTQNLGPNQLRANQLLYVVTFKACRSEVFYVSEGTGLQIKPGDLVIVEADRGTDLGTVAQDSCSWPKARELRDHYTNEHYRWLMMFSRHGQNGASKGHDLIGQQVPSSGSHVGSTGVGEPSNGMSNAQEPLNGEIKPKMVKRLAQAHEIQMLREKEGNEAKAKRVCQQKVVEHRLNMEILDAEFQMDWKKLTFYYFADAYINFNPLVTDLFKIYKTRIWMSAINPASFATPTSGLQAPSGLGHTALLPQSSPNPEGRAYRTVSNVNGANAAQPGLRSVGRVWDAARESPSFAPMAIANNYPQTFQTADYAVPQMDQYPTEYTQPGQAMLGLPPRYNPNGYDVPNVPNSLYPSGLESRGQSARNPGAVGGDWNRAFQGLSLGM